MKLLPSSTHSFELIGSPNEINDALRKNVYHSERLISSFTTQSLIGTVDHEGFRVISSSIRMGAFCVAKGKIETDKLQLELHIHLVFKVFAAITALLPVIGFIVLSIIMGFDKTVTSIYSPILSVLVLRFIFIEFGFRYLSKSTLSKITDILDGLIKPEQL